MRCWFIVWGIYSFYCFRVSCSFTLDIYLALTLVDVVAIVILISDIDCGNILDSNHVCLMLI
jgi:hypothetical protein